MSRTTTVPDPATLVACPACDLLHRRPSLDVGMRARCTRCGTTLLTRKPHTVDRALAATIGALVLYVAAVSFPFLSLAQAGLTSEISVVDAVRALWAGGMPFLAGFSLALILIFPLLRLVMLFSVLLPLRLGRPVPPWGRDAFRWASRLEPWAMAEIFMIGVIVSLIKVADLADLTVGPSFWALSGLVVASAFVAGGLCKETVWRAISRSAP